MLLRFALRIVLLSALAVVPALSQCTFFISPSSANFASSSNDSVITVSASATSCAWTSRSNTSWITISFGQSGTGNGSVGFTVSQNNTFTQRTGSLVVAGITFNVTQAGAACSYSLSPATVSVSASGQSGSFSVNTGCTWTAVSNNTDWLNVGGTASGSGTGTVQYTAAPNLTGAARTGTITVGTQAFTVNQLAPCTYTLTPFSVQADPTAGATGTFTVATSSSGCAWTATSANPDFITVTSGASGTGSGTGTVGYTVAPNRTLSARSGAISVGTTAFTVYQAGGQPCSFALSAAGASFAATGGGGSFGVVSACTWTPSASDSWISLASNAPTTGNGTVSFVVAPNTTSSTRTGSVNVGGQQFTITQTGVPCSVTVGRNNLSVSASGAMGSIDVFAPDGCSWSATTAASWIALGSTGGTGQGSLRYTAAANTTSQARNASITIANQVVSLAQDGASCGQTLTPASASLPAGAGSYSFHIDTVCAYSAMANVGWIKITAGASGTGAADIAYTVSANTGPDARTGSIALGGQSFAVSQSGAGCSLTLSNVSGNVGGGGGNGSFGVTATGNCVWQPKVDVGWIHFTFAAVNGSGTVTYTADANTQSVPRVGHLLIADQTFQVVQAAKPAVVTTVSAVLNAASFAQGPVAPGEILTIFGAAMGPAEGVTLQLTQDGQMLTSSLAGTRVLFDGNPAPLIYVSDKQVSAIVPYAIAGAKTTQLQVAVQGVASAATQLNVAPTSPALFTINASGTGGGAILNQDTTVNTAANPAAKGSVVVLFCTGEGQTAPPGVDGQLAVNPLPAPVAPVRVQIGGAAATVLYAGGAPGLPAGVLQVNVRVPANAASGALPVVLTVGNAASPAGVTVMVR